MVSTENARHVVNVRFSDRTALDQPCLANCFISFKTLVPQLKRKWTAGWVGWQSFFSSESARSSDGPVWSSVGWMGIQSGLSVPSI